MEPHSHQNAPHRHHPLYAFLQSSETSRAALGRDERSAPGRSLEPSHGGNGDATTARHLSSLLTTVRAHSTQLDQMVNHLNSLVTRVESVETIFSEGQEQVRQMVSRFQTDAATLALQTGDRVNDTLEPALNSFNHCISSLGQQLDAIRTTSEQHTKTHGDHALGLSQLEKDVQHSSHQLNQLDARLNVEQAENLKRYANLEQEMKKLNSALEPNSVLVPLLTAFLESQLRATASLQGPVRSFEKSDSLCGEKETTDNTKVNTRAHSSGVSMRLNSAGSHVSSGILKCPQTSTRIVKTMQQADSNLVENPQARDCQKDGGTTRGMMQSDCHTEKQRLTSVNQRWPSESNSKKVAAEPEPTVTQDSVIDSGQNSQAEQCVTGASQIESSDRDFNRTSIDIKTAGLGRLVQKTVQQDDASRRLVGRFDDAMKTNSRKRSRSTKSPEFESKHIRSNSVLTQRKISLKRVRTSSTVASKNDLQSQPIKGTGGSSVEYKVRMFPLILFPILLSAVD